MIKDVTAYIKRAAAEAKAAAKQRKLTGYARKSFLSGQWIVISDQHPEVSGMRTTFLTLAGGL